MNNSVTDFLIVEYNSDIGGRVAHTTFGVPNNSYTIELGANWVRTSQVMIPIGFGAHAEGLWNRCKA